jgi:carboxyl-terminal processing protease
MWKVVRIATPLLLVIVLIVAYFGAGCDWSWWSASPTELEFDLVEEAWQIILDDFVDSDKLDLDKLSQGAIEGLIEALDDPYSAYFDAEQYALSLDRIEGSFGGIGTEITIDEEGQLTIVAPFIGTPAQREGIMPGDKILEIDGETTEGISLIEAALKIRGEPGTKVTLRVLHRGEDVPEDIVITREEIKGTTISHKMLPDTPTPTPTPTNIAYIEVDYFSSRTGDEIVSALEDITASDMRGIILDLRDNPGGALEAAVDLASQFLEEGVVAYVIDGKGNEETWEVREGGLATDLPLVVLVNGNSASGSELVAGALQDHGRGIVIGTKTLGKGRVNHFHELSDGSAIYITIAWWYTPNGRQIEGQGILPDVTVERTAEDIERGYDPQLERAIEYIKSQ